MVRYNVFFFYLIFSFTLISISAEEGIVLVGEKKEGELFKTLEVPDPLDLKNNWWSYFQVPAEQLKDHIQQVQKMLNVLRTSLTPEEHQSLLNIIDRIGFNLDILLKKKQQAASQTATTVQFLKKYSPEQLIQVNKNYLLIQTKRFAQEEKLKILKTQFGKIQSSLDESLLQYYAISRSSYTKLRAGLKIMDSRIELAIVENDIALYQKRIQDYLVEEKRLEDELKIAQEKLAFDFISSEMAKKAWLVAEVNYEKAKSDLHFIRKSAFYEEQQNPQNTFHCCLWSQKVISESIRTETAKFQLLIETIKHLLFQIAEGTDTHSISSLRNLENQWKKQINETLTSIKEWETTIHDEQTRLGHEMAHLFAEKDKNSPFESDVITTIHLEFDQSLAGIQELKMLTKSAELLYKQIDFYILKEKNFFDTWTIRLMSYFDSFKEVVTQVTNVPLFRIHNNPVTAMRLLQSILIILLCILLSRFVRKTLFQETPLSRALSKSTEYVVARCVHYGIIVIGIIAALAYIGLDFTNFVIVAGALGVGIGFGLQSLVNDIISGFLLLFQQNLKVGDIIEINQGSIGRVMAINLQNTHVKSFDGIDLIIPNAQLTSQLLNNWTLNDSCRRYRIPFKVAYGTDKEWVRRIVLQAASKLPCTKKGDFRYPDPQLWLVGFGDNAIEFELVVWVDLAISLPHGTAVATYFWEIETALKENGIVIPVPKRDVYIQEGKITSSS